MLARAVCIQPAKQRELARSKLSEANVMQRALWRAFFPGFPFLGLVLLGIGQTVSGEPAASIPATAQSTTAARMNCGAKIECVTPDGRSGHVSRLPAQGTEMIALIMNDDTVTCLLQQGETNFVVELPRGPLLDRFTFLNENAAARGELRISVSNQRLPANSPQWKPVAGIIPFAHKRLFGVSLLGIEARFVRFSFRVDREEHVAAFASCRSTTAEAPGFSITPGVRRATEFKVSALNEALNSSFAAGYRRSGKILVTATSPSVGPLSP